MIASDQRYPDPISPDDPRYQCWLVVRGFIQQGESAARAELLKALEKNRSIEASDIVRLVERSFRAAAATLVATVNSIRSAEKIATALDELLKRTLVDRCRPWFLNIERVSGIDADDLELEAKLRLNARLQEFKTQAFRFGLDGENARRNQSRSAPSTPEQSDAASNNIAVSTKMIASKNVPYAHERKRPTAANPESALNDEARREAVIRKVRNPQGYASLLIVEAALYYQVAPRTIHRWIAEGKLRRAGRRGSVTTESIQNWDQKRSRKPRSI